MIRDRLCKPSTFLSSARLLGLAALIAFSNSSAHAQPDYLGGRALSFTLPGAPSSPAILANELEHVRSGQVASPAFDEATVDAKAYDPDMLLGRFSDGALTPLVPSKRPFLMFLLGQALPEVGRYSDYYKKVAERPRPYAEDSTIRLCYDDPKFPLDPKRSYPSGHAANGYAAALILAEVFPARRQQILARGIRYGDNRVTCGAHHPSDVSAGQLIATEYYEEASQVSRFKHDLKCAQAENGVIEKFLSTLPPDCILH